MSVPPPDIFISYAREDVDWVRPLAAGLEQCGWRVFWDQRIPAGKSWRSHIGVRLESARCVIVVWSEFALKSKFVLQEADIGLEREVLMPVLRQPVRPPLGFREVHAANLAEWRPGESSPEFETFMADLGDMLISSSQGPPAALTEPEGLDAPGGTEPPFRVAGEPAETRTTVAGDAVSPKSQTGGIADTTPTATTGQGRARKPRAKSPSAPTPSPRVEMEATSRPEVTRPELTAPNLPAYARHRLIAAGDVFRDVDEPWCPELVVIPAGSFTMGSPKGGWFRGGEEGRDGDEGPQREVRIARAFAMGRHTVTRGQFGSFVAATKHDMSGGAYVWTGDKFEQLADRDWRDPGFAQTDAHPVVCVSWLDAQAYVGWLAERTGQPYRLPTEAEWEYAARAGTETPFWTGATISTAQANYDGNYTYGGGPTGLYRERTVAVDDPSFPANPFGLYHVHGNVWEWVKDCYTDSFKGAPSDGHYSVDRNDCPGRVLRGGSWYDDPRNLRSAYRNRIAPDDRFDNVGFRVARMLTP